MGIYTWRKAGEKFVARCLPHIDHWSREEPQGDKEQYHSDGMVDAMQYSAVMPRHEVGKQWRYRRRRDDMVQLGQEQAGHEQRIVGIANVELPGDTHHQGCSHGDPATGAAKHEQHEEHGNRTLVLGGDGPRRANIQRDAVPLPPAPSPDDGIRIDKSSHHPQPVDELVLRAHRGEGDARAVDMVSQKGKPNLHQHREDGRGGRDGEEEAERSTKYGGGQCGEDFVVFVGVDQAQGTDGEDVARYDKEHGDAGASGNEESDEGALVPVVKTERRSVADLEVLLGPHQGEVVCVDNERCQAAETV